MYIIKNMPSSVNYGLSYLERLSTQELKDLAIHFGIDIPQDLDRPFVIEELLDNAPCLMFFQAGNLKVNRTEMDFVDDENIPPVPDPVELPKHYNITQIDAIVRDPLWVFVFWEIREADRKIYEKSHGFRGYFLRVSLDKCKMGSTVSSLFTIPVSPSDSEWYIHFPPDGPCRKICNTTGGMPDATFNVALCAAYSGGEATLAVTTPFRLPRMLEISERSVPVHDENTLLRMSGIDDLMILRNTERISVLPKNDSPHSTR
ncbi:MAG: DUF4912 domain-containing protein [Spirochaetaceae bacterium]|jgi:hypothetical protein|nr:DUF4912 domain-containing protein [Spirochaetaceae bacterium]